MNNYADCFFVAARNLVKFDWHFLRELFGSGLIKSHRDFYDEKYISEIAEGSKDRLTEGTSLKLDVFLSQRDKISELCDEYMERAERENIFVASVEDEDYPVNWKNQSGMPRVFFGKGNRELLQRTTQCGAVAIVGSRGASKYALFATEKFASGLGEKNIVVVSGMAAGVDRQAHLASVKTKGGTIAILAGGPDSVYPSTNQDIYDEIVASGLVLSEIAPGGKAIRQYFPSRNRLIAGLSDCCLIMEAGEVSGTLHTASYAAAQGKEVFVLPNNIYFEAARGGTKLLADGANVLVNIEQVEDSVISALMARKCNVTALRVDSDADLPGGLREKASVSPDLLSDSDWKIVLKDLLTLRPLNIDEICANLNLPFGRASGIVTAMELTGDIYLADGKYRLGC